jgi:hypothetical protein
MPLRESTPTPRRRSSEVSDGSPPPTSQMPPRNTPSEPGACDATKRVSKRCFGPKRLSAVAPTSSLSVDAGATGASPRRSNKTAPSAAVTTIPASRSMMSFVKMSASERARAPRSADVHGGAGRAE